MPDPTVAASLARALMEFATSRGAPRSALLERSGMAPADLSKPDHRIPFARYVALMRGGKELCDDPALALHFGESTQCTDISFASMIAPASQSLSDMLAAANRYARLTVDVACEGAGDRFRLARQGGQLHLIDARKDPNAFPELTESAFARFVSSSRSLYDGLVTEVHVTHAAPAYRGEYARIFRVPVRFSSERNALVTDARLLGQLATTFASTSPAISEVLKVHAEALLQRLDASTTVRARVEALLGERLPTGDVGIESVSRELGLSRQTLFRRLKAEGVTFEQVLDHLRRTRAVLLLEELGASVRHTAHQVGFSDPAAFSRAFKRWTGESPRGHSRS